MEVSEIEVHMCRVVGMALCTQWVMISQKKTVRLSLEVYLNDYSYQ